MVEQRSLHAASPPVRVDFLTTDLFAGGVARSLSILANGLLERGYDVRLVVLNPENAFYREHYDPRIPITYLHHVHVRHALGSLAAYLRESRPTLCFSQYPFLTVALVLLKRLHHLPMLVIGVERGNQCFSRKEHTQDLWRGHAVPTLIRWFYRYADHGVGVSQGTAQQMVREFGFDPAKVTHIYNAVDPPLAAQAAALYGTPALTAEKTGRDLYAIGRLTYQKGFDRLLDAFALCLPQRPDLRLHLVGEGPLHDALQQQAYTLGIADRVTFHDFTRDIAAVYRRATLVVMSSHYEAFGNVIVEAMAFGTPVVAFDCDFGPSEIIIDGVNGFLVPQNDIPGLAQAILRALAHPWDTDAIVATAQRFSEERAIQHYVNLINRLTDPAAPVETAQ